MMLLNALNPNLSAAPRAAWVKRVNAGAAIAATYLCLIAQAPEVRAQSAPIAEVQVQPDWKRHFDEAQAVGTLVIRDERGTTPRTQVWNAERAGKAFTPASTYKIPHTLFALDAGVVRDEFQVFKWDGVPRSFAGHNADQTLRSAMRNSTLWVYQGFAAQIGPDKARGYLKSIDYGNADPTAESGDYWVDGGLAISAHGQIAFLRKLYANSLPFAREHQRLVKDLIINEAGRDWILRAKTGWSGRIGWWVGWVERPEGPVFFALNIDTPGRMADLPKRERIVRAVLVSMDVLKQ